MMYYLASVYSLNADADLRQQRYEYALKRATEYTLKGIPVFSPIIHSHPMSVVYDMPCEFAFWEKLDYNYLDNCDALWVLKMDGWEQSRGVQAEIAYCKSIGKRIKFIECLDSPPASSKQTLEAVA